MGNLEEGMLDRLNDWLRHSKRHLYWDMVNGRSLKERFLTPEEAEAFNQYSPARFQWVLAVREATVEEVLEGIVATNSN